MVQLSGLLASVPVFLVLISGYGLTGAAVALLISTALRLAFTVAAYPLFLRVPMPRVWIDRSDLVDLAGYRGAVRQTFARFGMGAAK